MKLIGLKKCLFLMLFLFSQIDVWAQNWLDIQDTTAFNKWKDLVLEAKQKYAPDSRSVYFQVSEHKDQSGQLLIETSSSEIDLFLKSKTEEIGQSIPVSVKLLPDTNLNDFTKGIINLSVANLRTNPSHSAELATQAILGTPVDILKKRKSFYLIRTPEGYLAWVDSYGISAKSEADMEQWIKADKAIFTDDYGHSYVEKNSAASRVSDLILGNILIVLEKNKEFWKIQYPDGRTGFVLKSQLKNLSEWKTTTRPNPENIIATAKRMLGVPYLWGGTSNKGVDCSGFTKTSYFMNGLIIPRDASQQALVGLAVDIMKGENLDVEKALSNLKKGDLIFFSALKGKSQKQPITHVAIYIENGEFIHAAGIVRINSFIPNANNFDDQTLTIVGARRYLGNAGFVPLKTIVSTTGY